MATMTEIESLRAQLTEERRNKHEALHREYERRAELERQVAALTQEVAELEDKCSELERGPWPKWAEECLKIIRQHSGYDGFDDASNGVDLPEELSELLSEWDQAEKRKNLPEGFQVEDLLAVAEALETEKRYVNVGNVTGVGDDLIDTAPARAAKFIRAVVASVSAGGQNG